MALIFKRYLQVEDHLEEIKRENEEKLQSLESIVKIFEIKARNASDHVGRLEDKENDMKQEYKRLHDRYCEVEKNKFFFFHFSIFINSYSKLIVIIWKEQKSYMELID
jgi:predicted nuclease with TOPRIM domain